MSVLFDDGLISNGKSYQINNSIVLNGSNQYLTRTPSVAGNRKTWTFSTWVKKCSEGNDNGLLHINIDNNNRFMILVGSAVFIYENQGGTIGYQLTGAPVYRDPSAWMHILVAYDSTTATSTDRVTVYVNGKLIALTGTYPSLNYQSNVNNTLLHRIGTIYFNGVPQSYINGYLSDTYLIDGAALTPNAFGEFDVVTGEWKPKKYTGADVPVYSMISRTEGTAIGNMTSGAGLAGLFDGNLSQANPSQPYYPEDFGWGGKSWGTGNEMTVAYAIAYGSSNYGFYNSGYSVTLSLQGSNDGGTNWSTLGTLTFTDDGTSTPRKITATVLDNYERHRILIDAASGATKASEFEFYEEVNPVGYFGTNGFYLNYEDVSSLSGGSSSISYTGGFGGFMTVINQVQQLPNSKFIGKIGVHQNSAENGKYVYIVRHDGGLNYTCVAKSAAFNHAGSGLQYVDIGYVTPSTGTYYMAVACPGSGLNWGHDTSLTVGYAYQSGQASVGGSFTASQYPYVDASNTPPALVYLTSNIGADASGNYNYWSPVNLTSSAQTIDTPTNNFATAFGLATTTGGQYNPVTPTNGGLNFSLGPYGYVTATQYIPSNLDVYFEVYVSSIGTDNSYIGVYDASKLPVYGNSVQYRANGTVYVGSTPNATAYSYAAGDCIGVYVSNQTSTIKFYKNSTLVYTATLPANSYWMFQVNNANASGTCVYSVNFGQKEFQHPSNAGTAKALCTTNLPTPLIKDGDKHFDVVTYTGNGSIQTISGLDFQPDFVWIKSRSNAGDHVLVDSVRGLGSNKVLASNGTFAETSYAYNPVTSFNSDGFGLAANTTGDAFYGNISGWSHVAWCWKAGGTSVSNTNGTITSQVSANPTAGFSIVSWTGGSGSVGHGLGIAPSFIIVKPRNQNNEWFVWHKSIPSTQYLLLNQTSAVGTSALTWNNTSPTNTVVTLGSGFTVDHVAYCWSEIEGFSKFGSYTGNGSTDGPFVYCGFKPRWIMVKRTDTVENWQLWDSVRDPYNVSNHRLFANVSDVEDTTNTYADITSNGFKIRGVGSSYNNSSGVYIFAAFADSPIKYANAR